MAEIIPSYLYAFVSIIILFFSLLKAGSIIFQMSTYEMMISLPVSKAAIVISRFLTMYIGNLILSLIIMMPGMIIYGIYMHPAFSYYIFYILGIFLLPIIPITLSTAIGAFITAISSRMKRKSIVNAVLTIIFCIGIIIVSSSFGSMENISEQTVINLTEMITEEISKIFPPAIWFEEAAVKGILSSFLILAGMSILIFTCLIYVLQKYFMKICMALNATTAKNNYKMESLTTSSLFIALWKKEIRHYFSSSVYVANTVIGYILMLIGTICLCVMGIEKIEELMQLPNVIEKLLPFYILSVLFSFIAIRPSLLEAIWLLLIPAVYFLFASNLGIAVNIAFPQFEWKNETQVVKQSASVLITMVLDFVSIIIPCIALFVLRDEMRNVVMLATAILLIVITGFIYRKNCKVKISTIL